VACAGALPRRDLLWAWSLRDSSSADVWRDSALLIEDSRLATVRFCNSAKSDLGHRTFDAEGRISERDIEATKPGGGRLPVSRL